MNTVHLHGRLGDQFGGPFDLDIRDAREAIRALGLQLTGFLDSLSEGNWRVVRGPEEGGQHLDEDSLSLGLGNQPLHIIPAGEGAGDGAGKALVGALMVGAAFFTGGASLAAMSSLELAVASVGAGILVGGVAMMLTPMPETGNYEDKEKNEQSFLFNGPTNVSKQGVAVPLIYGQITTGSVVISAGIRAEDIPISSDSTTTDAFGGDTGYFEGK